MSNKIKINWRKVWWECPTLMSLHTINNPERAESPIRQEITRSINKQLKEQQQNTYDFSMLTKFIDIYNDAKSSEEVAEKCNLEFGWTVDRHNINQLALPLKRLGIITKNFGMKPGRNRGIILSDEDMS